MNTPGSIHVGQTKGLAHMQFSTISGSFGILNNDQCIPKRLIILTTNFTREPFVRQMKKFCYLVID